MKRFTLFLMLITGLVFTFSACEEETSEPATDPPSISVAPSAVEGRDGSEFDVAISWTAPSGVKSITASSSSASAPSASGTSGTSTSTITVVEDETITYTITDADDRTAIADITVTVSDNPKPTITVTLGEEATKLYQIIIDAPDEVAREMKKGFQQVVAWYKSSTGETIPHC